MHKDRLNRIMSTILVAFILLMSVGPTVASADTDGLSSQLGTAEALGSPVMNRSFNTDEWNRWELAVFGIFMSNFCVPFVDSYNTAFNTNSNKGSDGNALKALKFESGADVESSKVLQVMVENCINAQKAQLRPIKVEFTKYIGLDKGATTEPRDALLEDLFMRDGTNMSGDDLNNKSIVLNQTDGPKIDGYAIRYYNHMNIPTFKYEAQKVLDYQDGWDLQMFNAWFGTVIKKGDTTWKAIEKYFDKPIYLDSFGNIVVSDDGEPIIVVPAASNQYLTTTPSYNMINSLLFSGSYTKADGGAIKNNAKVTGGFLGVNPDAGAASFLKDTGSLEDGSIIMYHDTDTYMYQHMMQAVKSGTTAPFVNMDSGYNVGKGVSDVISSNIGKDQSRAPLKIEIVGAGDSSWYSGSSAQQLKSTSEIVQYLSNIFITDTQRKMLKKIETTSGDVELLTSPVAIPVLVSNDNDNGKVSRNFLKYVGEYITGSTEKPVSVDLPAKATMVSTLARCESLAEAWKYLHFATGWENGTVTDGTFNDASNILKAFVIHNKDTDYTIERLSGISPTNIRHAAGILTADNMKNSVKKVINAYPSSEVQRSLSQTMGLVEGVEFSKWSTWIYGEYLSWYGVLGSTGSSNLNTALFTNSNLVNTDGETLFGEYFMSEEEKKAAVLEYSYLMLTPSNDGREYRAEVASSWMNDRMIKTYKSVVYGGASFENSKGVVSKYANGFLAIPSYSDNFMTSWLMEGYAKYAVALIGFFFIVILIVGIITHRKFSWFIIASVLVINTLLILPAAAEITPYMTNKAVQNMFSNNMTFWSISESVNNEKVNAQASESDIEVAKFAKMLNITYSDRSLVINSDISKKVLPNITSKYEEIQKLQSARWLLPSLMRQFSAADSSNDYVTQPLADLLENMDFMYWSYNSLDGASVNNYSSSVFVAPADGEYTKETVSNKQSNYFDNYIDTSVSGDPDTGVTVGTGYKSWKSLSREKGDTELSHTNFYMIDGLRVRGYDGEFTKSTWKDFREQYKYGMDDAYTREMQTKLDEMFNGISEYIVNGSPTEQYYGYLWMTENIGHYFFQVTKDTFTNSITTQRLISELAGYYELNENTGKETRRTMMHYNDTGHVRDLLDMEELFTNVLPYMYQLELAACGTNGTNGLLGNSKIGDKYPIYSDNYQSWMFRSNWVTKLMESREFNSSGTVRDSEGKRYSVANTMMPDAYPDERPMIFSEAEMFARGLDISDLTIVEAKILDVNKEVEKKWTMLINYANTSGISTEVFYKQMALDAMLIFNNEFAPDRLINSSKALYPSTLDLRNISFDSVMKMLMIGGTRDSSYVFGDTMSGVIERGDVFTSVMLIIVAILCAFIIPLVTCVVLGAIFYLGIWAMITNLIAGARIKVKLSTAFIINNIVYLLITLGYYLVFSLMVTTNTADSVLSADNISVTVGSPTWVFLIIFAASLAYIALSIKLLQFTLVNYRDLGFEAYATIASVAANRVGASVGKVASKFGIGGGAEISSGGISSAREYNESNMGDDIGIDMGDGTIKSSSKVTINQSNNQEDNRVVNNYTESGYYTGKQDGDINTWSGDEINKQIQKGKTDIKNDKQKKYDEDLMDNFEK